MTIGEKLDPRRFTAMSPKMTAIVAYLLGDEAVATTDPAITEIHVTSDGVVLAGLTSDRLANEILGDVGDLRSNLSRLAAAAELTTEERLLLDLALATKVVYHGHPRVAIY